MNARQARNDLNAETVREWLDYNPATGKFYSARGPYFGREIGSLTSRGYIKIRIGCAFYLAHRLAWLYVHGEWPSDEIDHINAVKTDNRIANLRDVTRLENMRAYLSKRSRWSREVAA